VDNIAFGRGVRALRVRARLRQEDLSARVGLSRGVVARVEQGGADRVTVQTLDAIAKGLDARVVVRLSWRGEGLDRLLDADHAALVEIVVRHLQGLNWQVATEVSFNHFGERGSIDILAFHREMAVVLVVEVKSVVADVQASLISLDRKTRLAREIAAERGWVATRTATLLVVRETTSSRRRIANHAVTFANAFPDRGFAVRGWLAHPDQGHPLRGLWFLSIGTQAVTRERVARARRPATHERRPISRPMTAKRSVSDP
jgi:transcriptional regulator with XRE-family HTH domain